MMNWGFTFLILSKIIALLKKILILKNVNICLRLVINPKDWVNKDGRQSTFICALPGFMNIYKEV